jgi:hypothetical protein
MLTPQQLAEAIEYLRAHGLTGGSEKRRTTRMQVQAKIEAARISKGRLVQKFTLLTRDISLMGLGLIQGVKVNPDEELVVTLPRMKGPPLHVSVTVRHCRDLADNLYSVGTEFNKEVPTDFLSSLQTQTNYEQLRLQQSILD